MRLLSSSIVIFALLATLSAQTVRDGSLYQAPIDEYAVYDAVIARMFAENKVTFDFGGNVSVTLLVIENRTVSYPVREKLPTRSDARRSSYEETLMDYQTKNERPVTLGRLFNLRVDYVLVDSAESNQTAYEREGSEVHGIVSLSRVGFNPSHTAALVYMSYYCGGLCGHGFTFYLVKSGDKWKVDKITGMWIS